MADEPHFGVVYLTGPPATGKSTLVAALEQEVSPLLAFSYSKELAEYVGRRADASYSQDAMRRESARVIRPEDVRAVDEHLLRTVEETRGYTHIVIDSRAVTKEAFGFRVTPFSADQIKRLRPTLTVCLYAAAPVIIDRVTANPQGRPTPTPFEADYHTALQGTLAVQYGVIVGAPVYFLDGAQPTGALVHQVARRIGR